MPVTPSCIISYSLPGPLHDGKNNGRCIVDGGIALWSHTCCKRCGQVGWSYSWPAFFLRQLRLWLCSPATTHTRVLTSACCTAVKTFDCSCITLPYISSTQGGWHGTLSQLNEFTIWAKARVRYCYSPYKIFVFYSRDMGLLHTLTLSHDLQTETAKMERKKILLSGYYQSRGISWYIRVLMAAEWIEDDQIFRAKNSETSFPAEWYSHSGSWRIDALILVHDVLMPN